MAKYARRRTQRRYRRRSAKRGSKRRTTGGAVLGVGLGGGSKKTKVRPSMHRRGKSGIGGMRGGGFVLAGGTGGVLGL